MEIDEMESIENKCIGCEEEESKCDCLYGEFKDVLRERDERQALLERVFGRSCETCSCLSEIGIWCKFVESNLEYESGGRDIRCPFLPFEAKS